MSHCGSTRGPLRGSARDRSGQLCEERLSTNHSLMGQTSMLAVNCCRPKAGLLLPTLLPYTMAFTAMTQSQSNCAT